MSDLPLGWCPVAIRDICDVRLGRQRSPGRATGPHMRPYMRAANVTWKGISLDDVKEMDFSPEEFAVFALRPGDVLVGEASGSRLEVGKSVVWRGEVPGACFQNTLIRLRAGDAVLPEYLQKHLTYDARRGALADIAKGIGIHHIGAAGLAEWQISLAPLPEQRRIADKLDALLARVDACRERLDRVSDILKRFRQSVLAAATSGELTREWREERHDSEPWREAALRELIGDQGLFSDGDWVESKDQDPAGGIRLIQLADIGDGAFVDKSRRFVNQAAFDRLNCTALEPGDVLVARMPDPLGRACVLPDLGYQCITVVDIAILRPKNAAVLPVWLMTALNSPDVRAEMGSLASGTTRQRISKRNLAEVLLRVPPVSEQEEIVRRTEALFAYADNMEKRLIASRAVVQLLTPSALAKAFRGELVPQDPTDEPASALLAKLKTEQANAAAEPSRRPPKTPGKRPTMSNTDKDSIKAAILKLKADCFSFDELRTHVTGDYESLKVALFELLEEPSPVVRQLFDKKAKAMQLVRVRP